MRSWLFSTILATAALGFAASASATAIFAGTSTLTIRIVDFAVDADGDGVADVDVDGDGLPDNLLGFKPADLRIDSTAMTGVISNVTSGTGDFTVSSTPSVTVNASDAADMTAGDEIVMVATASGSASAPPPSTADAIAATQGSLDFYFFSDDVAGYFVLLEISQVYSLSASADDLLNESAQASLQALVQAGSGTLHAFNDQASASGATSASGSDTVLVALWVSPLPTILRDLNIIIPAASLTATNDISSGALAAPAAVETPEPAALGLLGLGLLGAAAARRRR